MNHSPGHHCPVCDFRGTFADVTPPSGRRRFARCPGCGALERHRLQSLVLDAVLAGQDPKALRVLHFAPEPFFRERFAARFGSYETADFRRPDVDHQVDLQALPFASQSYDLLFASHVLEHVKNDRAALAEIARVLRPGGLALLPVPLVAVTTIEYPHPVSTEDDHVRAPGDDYYRRYEPYFRSVRKFRSEDFSEAHQTFVYEDRTGWPNAACPFRRAMAGERHSDVVPVCVK